MNIEIFPCSGGMSEGFRRAGIDFDMAIDYDPNACESHEKNLGLRPLQMDVRDFLRMARLGWRPAKGVRLIVADPPCTPWSRAGKRKGLEDERDMLRETTELITILRPDFYLIGNVPGLQDSTSWGVVQDVIGGLGKHGYCVADYAQLDAADYGVPQHRVRPFWFGHPKGAPCIRWPQPTHGAPIDHATLPGLEPLPPWVTCRQALQHLPLEDLGRPVRIKLRPRSGKDGSDETRCSQPDKVARTVVASEGRKGGQIMVRPSRHDEPVHTSDPDAPARALTTQCRAPGHASTLLFNERHPPSRPNEPAMVVRANRGSTGAQGGAAIEWPWDHPSSTVWRDERPTPSGHHGSSCLSGDDTNAVILSERAAAILQGFPETWVFAGETKKARWAQIGMAMPPPLAHAVARAVREAMDRAMKTEAA